MTTTTPMELTAEPVVVAHAELGEGPTWDPETSRLLWVDIDRAEVHWFDPAQRTDQLVRFESAVGAAGLRQGDGLVLAIQEGFALWDGGRVEIIAAFNPPDLRMNDGKVDPAGRFWAGSMALDERPGVGTLYRLDPDHRVTPMLDGLTISNGLDWTSDGATMYFIDSMAGGVDRFGFDMERGTISGRTRVVDIPDSLGLPDGMTLDEQECLWVAIWGSGQVRRFAPDGTLLAVVAVDSAKVSSCAFGGEDLGDLYITTAAVSEDGAPPPTNPLAGSVFRCRPGVRGRPANRYRG